MEEQASAPTLFVAAICFASASNCRVVSSKYLQRRPEREDETSLGQNSRKVGVEMQ
jgi:hypothetical protein